MSQDDLSLYRGFYPCLNASGWVATGSVAFGTSWWKKPLGDISMDGLRMEMEVGLVKEQTHEYFLVQLRQEASQFSRIIYSLEPVAASDVQVISVASDVAEDLARSAYPYNSRRAWNRASWLEAEKTSTVKDNDR